MKKRRNALETGRFIFLRQQNANKISELDESNHLPLVFKEVEVGFIILLLPIHERQVFDCKNRYGEVMPQQEKALEALGFELPYPDKKISKTNNRKVVFDAKCREILFDICEKRGLHLDKNPEFGQKKHFEKQEYIIQKQNEVLEKKAAELSKMQSQLDEMTLKVEELDTLVDEVAESAYDKAVEVVTKTVQLETMKADLNQVESVSSMLDDKKKNYPIKKKIVAETPKTDKRIIRRRSRIIRSCYCT